MNEQLKTKWLPLLKECGIKDEYFDKVLRYVDMLLIDNTLYGSSNHNIKEHKDYINDQINNILPISLRILSKVDLSRIDFINYPMGMRDIMLQTDNMDNVVDLVSNFINMNLEDGFEIKIYKVIQNIYQDDDFKIHCRMKFNQPGEYEHDYINNIDGKIFPTEDDTYF